MADNFLAVFSLLLMCTKVEALVNFNKAGEFYYGNFLKSDEGKAINKTGTLISNDTTENKDDCLINCIQHSQCLSINLLRSNQPNVFHCELLSWAATDFSRYLEPRANSLYSMQLMTACLPNPCQNGGECIANTGKYQYLCNCTGGYAGRNCEKKCVLFDFEDGSLARWSLTGTAFNNQPTYGDNAVARGYGVSSNLKGAWWIGTCDNRPSPSHTLGAVQDDGPTGTMTSPPFIIKGKTLKFLIGGGSDINTERVELLIEETVVAQATGANSDTMVTKTFDVTSYRGQAAKLRIVDASSGAWGHINADHFENSICTE